MDWKSIAQERQDHRSKTIAAVEPPVPEIPKDLPSNVTGIPRKLLPEDVITITETGPEILLQQLASQKLTCTAVTKAFLQRAGLASRLTNCVTELLPDRALSRAKYLDDYLHEHGKPIGPLHGLPISVKEHIGMKGLDQNGGFISWVGRVAPDDAIILKLLWNAGAVFYARTTEPQTLMHLETSNNIYGVTVNPYNSKLTSGGSSGGEGALLGMKGSCGSIRVPAANNGVFGLRPTSYRLPLHGIVATMVGEELIIPVVGPLGQSLEGIKLFMKSIIDQQPWLYDPSLAPFPWKDASKATLLRQGPDGRRKLHIGLMPDDGIVKPHPPILRGIQTLVDRIKDHPDIEIIDFPPYKHDEGWRIISTLYFADGAVEEYEAIDSSGEPWRPLSNWIIKENPNVKTYTLDQSWKLTLEREGYKAAYASHWNSVGTGSSGGPGSPDAGQVQDKMVDVILCPAGAGAAPPLDCTRYWSYTSQWNLLDYPAVVFPTGLACSSEDQAEKDYPPRNEQDAYNHKLYDPATYADAPISLQLVGRRYEDEKVIEALEMILDVAGLPKISTDSKI
ncbi:hypothetical protein M409DRAFT_70401 [Zasmidium cellare ATCC 36951]|uniref:Amidase domain-containing protein n=1 Tax=Zasmidium cellare ATCC 36951 TaxID=1080233 RepID=A0A6A6C0N2_ZASCE|nr:uncharacterized protein M409DRAFT_70401 [Zasmidium cellare ATCC 36951]KAF2160433.1 hypothetical protein M409DRAFT_70401 [Zasmidium cellare ATCC 36951]